jgi:morphogenetic protein associated with SpoVID
VKIHIVQKGDTLWKIAKKYGVNFEELKKMNTQLSNPDMIMPGMKIKIPTTGGTVKKETKINYAPKKEVQIPPHPYADMKPPAPKEVPKKEVPMKPYIPKMPQPVVPEIDINNYYMMNMANMQVQQAQQAQQIPPTPPKPIPVKEEVKPEVPPKEMPKVPYIPPMYCYPYPHCVPVTPVMPGAGFHYPMHGVGAPMPQPGMPMYPMNQMMPADGQMMQQMGNYDDDESSPYGMMPMYEGQQGFAPTSSEMPIDGMMPQMGYPMMPYYPTPSSCYPVSPMMPGAGYPMYGVGGPMPQMQEPQMYPMSQMMPTRSASQPTAPQDHEAQENSPVYGNPYGQPYPYGYGYGQPMMGGYPMYGMGYQQPFGMPRSDEESNDF